MESNTEPSSQLSKRQLKKLAKHQKWLETRPTRRAKEREEKKKRKAEAVALGLNVIDNRKRLKAITMDDSPCKLQVAIDMSFDHLMTERDVQKALKQIQRCYAVNRRAVAPLQFYLTSFTGLSRQRTEAIQGNMNWNLNFRDEDYITVFGKNNVVYLTSDSPNTLQTLNDEHAYIIGGLVDHNQHKGLCYKLATEKGVAHARLPIDEFIDMKTRKVLAINHVFEILLRHLEGNSWETAFLSVLPQRKGAESKSAKHNSKDNSTQECDIDVNEQSCSESEDSRETNEVVEDTDLNKPSGESNITNKTK